MTESCFKCCSSTGSTLLYYDDIRVKVFGWREVWPILVTNCLSILSMWRIDFVTALWNSFHITQEKYPSMEVQHLSVVLLCGARRMCACYLICYPRDINVTLSGVIAAAGAASHCREETRNPDHFAPFTFLMWFQLQQDSHLLPIQPLLAVVFLRSPWNFIIVCISLPSCGVYDFLWIRHTVTLVYLA